MKKIILVLVMVTATTILSSCCGMGSGCGSSNSCCGGCAGIGNWY